MTNVYQLFKPGRAIPDHYKDPCITMENNRLVVTPYGLASLGPYARKIGINLAEVYCFDQYLEVRERLAPFFWQRLSDGLIGDSSNLEIKALRALIQGNDGRLAKLMALIKRMRERCFSVEGVP